MAESTNIAWTRSTFNPWIGCTKISPGCDHCYASVSTPARTQGIKWGAGNLRIRTSSGNWKAPLRWNERARSEREAGILWAGRPGFWPVFCGSLCDVFDNEVPDEWRRDLWDLIELTPHLTWLLLTKRVGNAARMLRSVDWAASPRWNAWIGASVVNQIEADRDIPKLLAVPAAKHFISYEPALGPVDFSQAWLRGAFLGCDDETDDPDTDPCHGCPGWSEPGGDYCGAKRGHRIDWIIVGGESDQPGMKARPFDIEWARSTVRQCQEAEVSMFVKQLGSAPYDSGVKIIGGSRTISDPPTQSELEQLGSLLDAMTEIRLRVKVRAGADPTEWPEDLRVREFPRV